MLQHCDRRGAAYIRIHRERAPDLILCFEVIPHSPQRLCKRLIVEGADVFTQCGGVNGCRSLIHHPWLFWGETTSHKKFVEADQEVLNLPSLNQGLHAGKDKLNDL